MVSALYQAKIIDEEEVTFWLNLDSKNDSSVIFGSDLPDNIKHHKIVTLPLEKK